MRSRFSKGVTVVIKVIVVIMALAGGFYLIFGLSPLELERPGTGEKGPPEPHDIMGNGEKIPAMEVVEILSDPEFMGRKTGSKGYQMAVRFIEGLYSELDLIPLVNDNLQGEMEENGYKQFYQQPYNELRKPFEFEFVDRRGVRTSPSFGENYIFDPSSDGGQVEADMVFVGFGIEEQESKYSDFSGVDIEDKVAVACFRLPESLSHDSYFDRVENIYQKGAKALVYIIEDKNEGEKIKDAIFSKWWGTAGVSPLPIVWIDEETGDLLLSPSNFEISSWREDYEIRKKPRSFPLDYEATIEVNNIREEKAQGINLVGAKVYCEDYPYVLLTAHLDSLGISLRGDEFPGANDNASGIGVMLETLSRINQEEKKFPFNIMLVAFGGEEDNLKGSKHFIKNLPVKSSKIQDVINIDMIGAGAKTLVAEASNDYAASDQLITALDNVSEQEKSLDYKEKKPIPRSDHWPFVVSDYSATFIYRPPEAGNEEKFPYHTSGDKPLTVKEEYLLDGVEVLIKLLEELAREG